MMDSFELNKVLGAVLGTLLFVMGVGFLAEAIYHPIEGRGPGYALPSASPEAESGGAGEMEAVADLGTLLGSADPTAGEAAARKCTGCHNFAQGAGNKQGPELYGVVGRPIGTLPDFAYSDGMLEHKAKGDIWTYENLNAFITSPKTFTPGTKMSFPGIKDDKERANVLAYLSTLASTPVPFPAPTSEAPADIPAPDPENGAAPQAQGAPAPTDSAISPEGGLPADAAPGTQAPVAIEGGAAPVKTPTTTQSETSVEGTPTGSGLGGSEVVPAVPASR